jgi:hypothetical protein
MADPAHLTTAVLNLVTNARQVMGVPNSLRHRTERQGQDFLELASGLLHGGMDKRQVRTIINQSLLSIAKS